MFGTAPNFLIYEISTSLKCFTGEPEEGLEPPLFVFSFTKAAQSPLMPFRLKSYLLIQRTFNMFT